MYRAHLLTMYYKTIAREVFPRATSDIRLRVAHILHAKATAAVLHDEEPTIEFLVVATEFYYTN